ncbi:sensor histidine kinase [Desulfospira joergensenii]|uniref:sensor histidine kinase n=1 Tax=Desulfospira joergensenii TaxID=53329 RepID=UPI0003B6AA6B|nr:PAS domain-containing sensor histidine kinase [Desulfospira joergensenii]
MKAEKTDPGQAVNRSRLKKSILITMIIVPLIPLTLAMGVGFTHFATALEEKTLSSLERIVGDHREMIQSFLTERRADLRLIMDSYDFKELTRSGTVDQVFDHLKKRSPAFVDLGIFDSKGNHLRYSGKYRLKGKTYRDESWFKRVMEDGSYVSDIFLGYRLVPHFIIAVRRGAGERAWVMRATIDTLFFERLVSGVRMGKTGEAYILNKTGITQSKRRSGSLRILDRDPEFKSIPLPETGIKTFIRSDASKNKYLYAATWMKNRDWLLVVRQEKRDAFASLYRAAVLNLVIMAVGGMVILAMAFYTTRRILNNIDRLGMEKKSLGNQLIRAVKLAEIGEMATGFAHEINNPLQIIKAEHSLIQSLLLDLPSPGKIPKEPVSDEGWPQTMAEMEESLDQIKVQVDRCSAITHSILKFGRKNEIKPERLNPGEIIPDILHLIENKARVNGIDLVENIPKNLPGFMGDPSQFQQVMLNLFNNAMDAIAQKHGSSGGILEVEARVNHEGRLEITITDNGTGISSENIDKVFSPFFTTKPVGKGTGLGLSVCYGIIESFGGTMNLTSRDNAGASFCIELPVNPVNSKEVNHGKNENHAGG